MLVRYEGVGLTTRRFLHADERGSIIAESDGAGEMVLVNRYDNYGTPASTNQGRFQYTGQMWIAGLDMYHYKARVYAPTLGRFLQTDPIGYADGMNLYAYVGNDPINRVDPMGLESQIHDHDLVASAYRISDGISCHGGSSFLCEFQLNGFGGGGFWSGGGGFASGPAAPATPDAGAGSERTKSCENPLAGSSNPMAVQYGQLTADYECGSLSREQFEQIDKQQGIATAKMVGSILGGAATARNLAVEGASKGYQLYGVGRVVQIRIGTDRLIIRMDANKPITHLNVQGKLFGRSFNFHIPRW